MKFASWVVVATVCFGWWFTGCKETLKQSVKNDAYSLASAWIRISDEQDLMAKTLQEIDEPLRFNLDQITQLTATQDSAVKVWADSSLARYTKLADALIGLKDKSGELQQAYQRSHEDYNQFQAQIDKDEIDEARALQQIDQTRKRQANHLDEVKNLRARYLQLANDHNKFVTTFGEQTQRINLRLLKVGE
jgi:chromosome segregation ATPase